MAAKLRVARHFLLGLMFGLLLVSGGTTVSLAADARLGWHDEAMPAGLERGDTHGEYLWTQDGAVMVFVPPGAFPMGSDAGPSDEKPIRDVVLSGYYIDKHEVSWQRFKQAGIPISGNPNSRLRQPRPPDWGIVDDHPAVNISWHDAVAYAEWAGKRLPTEAEWEKAARGVEGHRYPWGNAEPTFERAVWRDHPTAKESTASVTCCEDGASPYGALNMAGNVYEWCADVYSRDYYRDAPSRDPRNDGPGEQRVLRGGAFVLELDDLRSAFRYRLYPVDRTPYIGFRTVVSQGSPEASQAGGTP